MTEISLLSFLAVLLFQFLGLFIHWLKMDKTSRVHGTFLDYLISDYPGRSMGTGAALIGSAWLSAASGAADNINPEILWALLKNGSLHAPSVGGIVAAVTAGYALDSMFNKGTK